MAGEWNGHRMKGPVEYVRADVAEAREQELMREVTLWKRRYGEALEKT